MKRMTNEADGIFKLLKSSKWWKKTENDLDFKIIGINTKDLLRKRLQWYMKNILNDMIVEAPLYSNGLLAIINSKIDKVKSI